ncbi:MAG TPA: TetR/AcrR family transcriptional regulator [Devosiaceae bacterium]
MAAAKRNPRNKRDRLVEAATALTYRQGYRKTTLSDIAQEADVPLGNVYYYFKTRDAIGSAVLAKREGEFEALRAYLDSLPGPRERLTGFIAMTISNAANVANFGCPMGSLCAELSKDGGELADRSNALLAQPMAYMAEQFNALGYADDAEALALQLQSSLQGASLLTQSFCDPSLLEHEGERLLTWIADL